MNSRMSGQTSNILKREKMGKKFAKKKIEKKNENKTA